MRCGQRCTPGPCPGQPGQFSELLPQKLKGLGPAQWQSTPGSQTWGHLSLSYTEISKASFLSWLHEQPSVPGTLAEKAPPHRPYCPDSLPPGGVWRPPLRLHCVLREARGPQVSQMQSLCCPLQTCQSSSLSLPAVACDTERRDGACRGPASPGASGCVVREREGGPLAPAAASLFQDSASRSDCLLSKQGVFPILESAPAGWREGGRRRAGQGVRAWGALAGASCVAAACLPLAAEAGLTGVTRRSSAAGGPQRRLGASGTSHHVITGPDSRSTGRACPQGHTREAAGTLLEAVTSWPKPGSGADRSWGRVVPTRVSPSLSTRVRGVRWECGSRPAQPSLHWPCRRCLSPPGPRGHRVAFLGCPQGPRAGVLFPLVPPQARPVLSSLQLPAVRLALGQAASPPCAVLARGGRGWCGTLCCLSCRAPSSKVHGETFLSPPGDSSSLYGRLWLFELAPSLDGPRWTTAGAGSPAPPGTRPRTLLSVPPSKAFQLVRPGAASVPRPGGRAVAPPPLGGHTCKESSSRSDWRAQLFMPGSLHRVASRLHPGASTLGLQRGGSGGRCLALGTCPRAH